MGVQSYQPLHNSVQIRGRVEPTAECVVDLLHDSAGDLICDLKPSLPKRPILSRSRVEVDVARCRCIRLVLAGRRVGAARVLRSLKRSTGLACMLASVAYSVGLCLTISSQIQWTGNMLMMSPTMSRFCPEESLRAALPTSFLVNSTKRVVAISVALGVYNACLTYTRRHGSFKTCWKKYVREPG